VHASRDGRDVWVTTSTGGYVKVDRAAFGAALAAVSRPLAV
jgi:hypothetical protein